MPKVKLGRKEFDVDCEDINAYRCGVSNADCAALAARMKSGEISRVKTLMLVRFFPVLFLLYFPPAFAVPSVLIRIVSQGGNSIGPEGAKAVADAMRANSSVQWLNLVRLCCY